MRREYRAGFSHHRLKRKPLLSYPGMHYVRDRYLIRSPWAFFSDSGHTRAVMHAGIANPQWWEKRPRHPRLMRNQQFYVSGKRPMVT